MGRKLERLSTDAEDEAIDGVISGYTLEGIAAGAGFSNKGQLLRYLAKYPEFMARFENALAAQCIDLEEQLLNCADKYDKDVCRTKMESISRILKFRNRKRYGDKTEVEMNLTVDISGALERAERRVGEIVESNVVQIATRKTDP